MKLFLTCLLTTIITTGLQAQTYSGYIDSFAKANQFNGTILIQEKNKISYQKSFGLADLQFKVPNSTDTRYKIASITKFFTAALIMKLNEAGKLELNKPIITYLPGYKGKNGDKITVHHLLNHTSGLGNIDTITSMESALRSGLPVYQSPSTTDDLLNNYCFTITKNNPGEVFDYNNGEYILLGKIIEKLYNKPYESVLFEEILHPLGMSNSGILHQQDIIEKLAYTYFYRDDIGKLVPDLPVYPENWYAAGAMYSTTNDLIKFANAIFDKKLLKQESLDRMFVSGKGEYGYGVWVYEDYAINKKNYRIVKRPGQIMGAQSMLFHILGTGSTIIILSNVGNCSLDEMAAKIAKRIAL
ncbi:MAG: beta-lactamase family protein [Chitinophagaceae bacterium]|nr:beta-lactamase family protein [Chitinophagaceae bacterium]